MQIRTRLTLLFTLIAAGILAALLFYVWWTYSRQTVRDCYASLDSKANLTAQTALYDPQLLQPLPINWIDSDADTLPYRDNISLYNDAYERVFTVHTESPPVSIKTLQEIQRQGDVEFKHRNLYALGRIKKGSSGAPFMVVVEGYCDPQGASRLGRILIYSFLLGIAGIVFLGWYFAGLALAPVLRIMNEMDSLRPNDLSRRLEHTGGKDEMSRLTATFNRLLDRQEHAFRMQRMFLSNISHELRNPLTAVRTQIDVTLQRDRDAASYKNALRSVLDDLREISEVEEKLLLLSKVINDPKAVSLEPVRLDEVLWQAKEMVQRRSEQFKITLELENLPESEERLKVLGNEALLRTALLNLMENGCKYSPDHRVKVRLICAENGRHIVEVIDNGPGIPAEEQAFIFEPFFRSPRHRSIKGAGIGLSLVQSILQLHHVEISVETPWKAVHAFIWFFHMPRAPKRSLKALYLQLTVHELISYPYYYVDYAFQPCVVFSACYHPDRSLYCAKAHSEL
ncbi:MAG: HAMP domain-containing protein [Lewinellaceae bacterium]|nr:HAMP domain-containing protein [Lewinellaceae bacterium]